MSVTIDSEMSLNKTKLLNTPRQNKAFVLFCCLLAIVFSPLAETEELPNAAVEKSNATANNQMLTGLVTVGDPLVDAEISVKCDSTWSAIKTRTNNQGEFSVNVKDVRFPCMVQAQGGRANGASNGIVLHGLANQAGRYVISPLSELVLANALLAVPQTKFSRFSQSTAPTASSLDAAQGYVLNQLNQQKIIHTAAQAPANLWDNLNPSTTDRINELFEALSLSQRPLKALVEAAAKKEPWAATLKPATVRWKWDLPSTLPEPVMPAHNPMSAQKVELGRFLFYDVKLSGNQTFSCASCHHQDKAFTDGRALGQGSTGELHPRSPQPLGNIAYSPTLTWANPTKRELEVQIDAPIFGEHPVELGVNDSNKTAIIQRFEADAGYQAKFKAAFPNQDNVISWRNIKKAIASFERVLLTGNSRYDQPHGHGASAEWTEAEERGRVLFFTSANCFFCHGNFNFTDVAMYQGALNPELRIHNTGLFNIGGKGDFPADNQGAYEFTKNPSDMGKFKAPSLRNIAVTAPYMHDGSLATLEDVLDFYGNNGRNITSGPNAGDGRKNPLKSEHINGIRLTAQDKADIIAFLKTLTDESFLTNPKFANPFNQNTSLVKTDK